MWAKLQTFALNSCFMWRSEECIIFILKQIRICFRVNGKIQVTFFLIEIWLSYNVSGVQQSDSVIYVYTQVWMYRYKLGCAVLSQSVVSDSVPPHGLQPARLLCPWGFSRQGCWSGLPCPSPGALPDRAAEPASILSAALQVASLPLVPPGRSLFLNITRKEKSCYLQQNQALTGPNTRYMKK